MYSVSWSSYGGSIKAFVFIVVVIPIILSCKESSIQIYKPNQITKISIEVIDAGNMEIKYFPILETLYFSPGANVTETEDAILLNFVRCPIKGTCKVTHAARQDTTGNYTIVVKYKGKPVFIDFDNDREKLYPK